MKVLVSFDFLRQVGFDLICGWGLRVSLLFLFMLVVLVRKLEVWTGLIGIYVWVWFLGDDALVLWLLFRLGDLMG